MAAKNFEVGMIAFLPYWGKLRKAKIVGLSELIPTQAGNKRTVHYKFVNIEDRSDNMCIMDETSVYEIYIRKKVKNER